MKNIAIAYHVYLYGPRYMEMITDQLRKIVNVKFHKDDSFEHNLYHYCKCMYVGVVDSIHKKPSWGVDWIKGWFKFTNSKGTGADDSKVKTEIYPDNLELRRTLHWVRDYAKNNPDDYILFFHTKGITHFTEATEDWRKYMEYFVLENWKDCIKKLDEGYDCCGVLWNRHTPIGEYPHFSGAFFWAKASYINTLDHSYIDDPWRYKMEFWIGSNPNAKVFEFHNSGYNTTERLIAGQGHYHVPYPRHLYAKS